MDESSLQVLEKAIFAGGKNLTSGKIAPKNKTGSLILTDLRNAGYLQEDGKKYSVTSAGRQAWEQQASEESKQALRRDEEQQRERLLVELFEALQAKDGKLGKPQADRFADAISEAERRKYLRPGPKANSYEVLSAGREFALSTLPPAQQLAELRRLHEDLQSRWKALHKTAAKTIESLSGAGNSPVTPLLDSIKSRISAAEQEYDAALGEIHGVSTLGEAASQLKATLLGEQKAILDQVARQTAHANTAHDELRKAIDHHAAELQQFREQLDRRLEAIQGRLDESRDLPSPKPKPEPQPGSTQPVLSQPAIWTATRQAHEQLRKEHLTAGGLVKIPELTDRVIGQLQGLSPEVYHQYLQDWQREDKLILQVCNDPPAEPRAGEGIASPRGLLFYVHMR